MQERDHSSGNDEISEKSVVMNPNRTPQDIPTDNFHEMSELKEFSSIYSKLNSLCTDLEHEILDLDLNHLNTSKNTIQWMKNESFKDLYPEVDYLTRLYFYFKQQIQLKLKNPSSSSLTSSSALSSPSSSSSLPHKERIHLVDYLLPAYVYEGSVEQVVGYEALHSNVFWIRLVTSVFALISFVVMSCVPMISHKRVSPHMLFYVSSSSPTASLSSPTPRMTAL